MTATNFSGSVVAKARMVMPYTVREMFSSEAMDVAECDRM